MDNRRVIRLILSCIAFISLLSIVQGSYSGASFTNTQTSQPNFNNLYSSSGLSDYWPVLNERSDCTNRQDIILAVSPSGCSPAVVRSDLLAEQNVPVFCQINAIQVNPLLDIKEIRSLSFHGNYSKEIAAVGFHPARAALRSRDQLLGDPIINNIGYAVVMIKKQVNESSSPSFVEAKLKARVTYNSGNAMGIGKSEFLLEELNDAEWETDKDRYGFFNGKYFVKLESVDERYANVALYSGDNKISSTRVELGKESPDLYLPGSMCRAALNVRFEGFKDNVGKMAVIEVSKGDKTDKVEVYKGSRFLDDSCMVSDIQIEDNTSKTGKVSISCPGVRTDLFLKPVGTQAGEFKIDDDMHSTNPNIISDIDSNFTKTINEYELLVKEYPFEINTFEGSILFGQLALDRGIELSEKLGKRATALKLMQNYVDKYPKGENNAIYKKKIGNLYKIDTSKSGQVLQLGNKYAIVRLLSLHEPKEKSNAEMTYNLANLNLQMGEKYTFTGIDAKSKDSRAESKSISLQSLTAERMTFNTDCDDGDKRRSNTLAIGESAIVCGKTLSFKRADLKKLASIKIIPKADNTETLTNLTIRVGIEQRAIKLTPEKANDRIIALNESIQKWDSISKDLEKVVTGLKAGCFATSAVLIAKNFLLGMSGTALARQQVMPYWKEQCEPQVGIGAKYSSFDNCYIDNADKINEMVSAREKVIQNTNAKFKEVQEPLKSGNGLLGDASIDSQKARIAMREKILADPNLKDVRIKRSGNNAWTVGGTKDSVSLEEALNENAVKNGDISLSEMRDLYSNLQSEKASDTGVKDYYTNKVGQNADRIHDNLAMRSNYELDAKRQQSKLPKTTILGTSGNAIPAYIESNADNVKDVKIQLADSLQNAGGIPIGKAGDADAFTIIHTNNKIGDAKDGSSLKAGDVLIALDKKEGENHIPIAGYEITERDQTTGKIKSVKPLTDEQLGNFGAMIPMESLTYSKRIAKPQVKYYENEPYKGMPSMVPVEINNGWYAATKQTLPVHGGIGAYDASGRVTSFWLCNAGKNGIMDFHSGVNDDTCRQFNMNTGQSLDEFPGLSAAQTRTLVNKAIQALEEAGRQYASGKKQVSIFGETIDVGEPSSVIPSTSCSDFMSAKECQLMFNLCDPVICPSSRCNLGGRYAVNDVIQSGIIGSAVLCLPNFPQVKIPVCLTGIQAGIDGWVSIQKQYRDCLQENIKTGRYLGLCDQFYSFSSCDFFWRQLAPIVKALLPNILASAYGQGARGGGEYMTVMAAWQNTQKSMDYFTQVYAVNSFKAFQARGVEEAGTEVCKSWVSAKAPTNFKSLVKPDSPSQFHAYFSSIKYSDVTVPATAQYSVFYHIFAGKDAGVAYRVYLKGAPEQSYYASNPYVQVASGFVGKGESKDEKKDFTAPEGYKELCVNIQGEEKCGFKQVSSSFAVNYVRDEIVANEIKEDRITSEKECISGSSNILAAGLNPSLDGAADELANPDIYRRGVIRICSTHNPGASTDRFRYVEAGNCGDEKIKCWIDQNSVDNAITDNNKGVRDETRQALQDMQLRNKDVLSDIGEVLGQEDANEKIRDFNGKLEGLNAGNINSEKVKEFETELDSVYYKMFYNHHKAGISYIKGKLFDKFTRALFEKTGGLGNKVDIKAANAAKSSGTAGTGTITDSKCLVDKENKLICEGKDTTIIYNPDADPGRGYFSDKNGIRIGDAEDGKIRLSVDAVESQSYLDIQPLDGCKIESKLEISGEMPIVCEVASSSIASSGGKYLTLNAKGEYDPTKEYQILKTNGDLSGIYILGNSIYLKVFSYDGKDKLGSVDTDNKVIIIFGSKSDEIYKRGISLDMLDYAVIFDKSDGVTGNMELRPSVIMKEAASTAAKGVDYKFSLEEPYKEIRDGLVYVKIDDKNIMNLYSTGGVGIKNDKIGEIENNIIKSESNLLNGLTVDLNTNRLTRNSQATDFTLVKARVDDMFYISYKDRAMGVLFSKLAVVTFNDIAIGKLENEEFKLDESKRNPIFDELYPGAWEQLNGAKVIEGRKEIIKKNDVAVNYVFSLDNPYISNKKGFFVLFANNERMFEVYPDPLTQSIYLRIETIGKLEGTIINAPGTDIDNFELTEGSKVIKKNGQELKYTLDREYTSFTVQNSFVYDDREVIIWFDRHVSYLNKKFARIENDFIKINKRDVTLENLYPGLQDQLEGAKFIEGRKEIIKKNDAGAQEGNEQGAIEIGIGALTLTAINYYEDGAELKLNGNSLSPKIYTLEGKIFIKKGTALTGLVIKDEVAESEREYIGTLNRQTKEIYIRPEHKDKIGSKNYNYLDGAKVSNKKDSSGKLIVDMTDKGRKELDIKSGTDSPVSKNPSPVGEVDDSLYLTATKDTLRTFCLISQVASPATGSAEKQQATKAVLNTEYQKYIEDLKKLAPRVIDETQELHIISPSGSTISVNPIELNGRIFLKEGLKVKYELLVLEKGSVELGVISKIDPILSANNLPPWQFETQTKMTTIHYLAEDASSLKLLDEAGKSAGTLGDDILVVTTEGLKVVPKGNYLYNVFRSSLSFLSRVAQSAPVAGLGLAANVYGTICAPIQLGFAINEFSKLRSDFVAAESANVQADNMNWLLKTTRENLYFIEAAAGELEFKYQGYPAEYQKPIKKIKEFTILARGDGVRLAELYREYSGNSVDDTSSVLGNELKSDLTYQERRELIDKWKLINQQLDSLSEVLNLYIDDYVKNPGEFKEFNVPDYVSYVKRPVFALDELLDEKASQDYIIYTFGNARENTNFVIKPVYDIKSSGSAGMGGQASIQSTFKYYEIRIKYTEVDGGFLWFDKEIDEVVGRVVEKDGKNIISIDKDKAKKAAKKTGALSNTITSYIDKLDGTEVIGTGIYGTGAVSASISGSTASSDTASSTSSDRKIYSFKLIGVDEDAVSIDKFEPGCLGGICNDLKFEIELDLKGPKEFTGFDLQENRKYGVRTTWGKTSQNVIGIIYDGKKLFSVYGQSSSYIELPKGRHKMTLYIQPVGSYKETNDVSGIPVGTPLNFPGGYLEVFFNDGTLEDFVIPPTSMYPNK